MAYSGAKNMSKQKIKYVVDVITFLSFLVTAITGLVIFLFLPPGEGRGRGVHNTLLGWGRHDWGTIHDGAGVVMIIFALIHVIFYWKVFVATTKNFFKNN